MAKLLKGIDTALKIREGVLSGSKQLQSKGITPTLAIIRAGKKGDDISYERSIIKCCEKVEVNVAHFVLPESISTEELLDTVNKVNNDKAIHGVLIMRPLPSQVDDGQVRASLSPEKDIDGITNGSLAGVITSEKQGFAPCTAQACMEILEHNGIPLEGKNVVVVGRSLVVGKPLAMMLLQKNATVTVCHSKTADLPSVCREAKVLFVAIGRAEMINSAYLSQGQTVIDVGIHVKEDGSLCGDVKFDEAEPVVEAITPVPGGVGTVTSSVLVKNVVEAANRQTWTRTD